ncbi:DNA modification methylase [Nocardioides terrae]|uniref:site-specific DNA-methyltransferase (cytosine-N(4)-specific) n=1 Tax=Nocardioides terrae TaxID=574651 RepID=A0A1I1DT64_9ACTN|nr:site-specific DNA-methyltransferase [Nocardioides terrae]SFB78209.1 DNA modification methylase [Nocardioides terrae]
MPNAKTPELVHRVGDPHAFERLLRELTGIPGTLSRDVASAVETVIATLGPAVDIERGRISAEFFGRLNQKMVANKQSIAALYAECAGSAITFNYPTKRRLEWAINTGRIDELEQHLEERGVSGHLLHRLRAAVAPVSHAETRRLLLAETTNPTKLRKQPDRDVANDVFNAAAGPLAWSIWPTAEIAGVFADPPMPFSEDYMSDLRAFNPALFERRRSLVVRQVRPEPREAYEAQRAGLTQWIADEFDAIDNYGFLAILINVEDGLEAEAWELASDLPLFAERFSEVPLKQLFFRAKDVERETVSHVTKINEDKAQFALLNEGFTYRDTFVLHDEADHIRRLLLVLQKNRRDETKVPCPGCRSDNIGGNSYPSFGVKSWECANPLCADRSIYNRGKRYDFRSLLKQEAIETDGNQISLESVRRWQRDVLPFISDEEILDTLLAHYSMRGDVVVLLDVKESPSEPRGRDLRSGEEPESASGNPLFWDSAFFCRYLPVKPPSPSGPMTQLSVSDSGWGVVEGDAVEVLADIPDGAFDRAVTSPPYYNAREYAQWPNLYAYMHDMYRIANEVFRTLKPGGLYVYNIFDYFDNERVVTFSDMGKKRLLLSGLMVDAFRRMGFRYMGSAVWDKGEIQGKRGFNAGNFSPFYQSPFNCWEHVIVVQKPAQTPEDVKQRGGLPCLNQPLRIHPVVKMVRGQNTLGHTAPYPLELVTALLDGLAPGSLVLDPFGGSGTTARGAMSAGHEAVLIERDPTYAELSRRLISEHQAELALESTILTLL